MSEENPSIRADVYEDDTWYIVELDFPGIPLDNIKIEYSYENHFVTVIATPPIEKEDVMKKRTYHIKERCSVNLVRHFVIDFLNRDSVLQTNYNNGTIEIKVKKSGKE